MKHGRLDSRLGVIAYRTVDTSKNKASEQFDNQVFLLLVPEEILNWSVLKIIESWVALFEV